MTADDRLLTPFGARTTALQVLEGVDLTGRRAIVTGGASGIGLETARALASRGASVILAVRDVDAGNRVAASIEPSVVGDVSVRQLDLVDQASVSAFVAQWQGPLHILVNNAGVMATPQTATQEGWELQFATNHLGHFALTWGLRPALAAAAGARVVSVSSSAHLHSPVVFEDIHYRERPYDPRAAYGQSKTANILFAVEAFRMWADDGILVNALMPGAIETRLQRHYTDAEHERVRVLSDRGDFEWKTPEEGAATTALLAASPLLAGVGGRYFEDCNEAEPHVSGGRRGVAAYALDPDAATRLWDVSVRTLGL